MALFQGQDAWYWFWASIILTILTVVGIWYYTITGRDRPPKRQRQGEETVVRYGSIEEDRAPLSKFLILTFIGVAIWAVGYALWTGINGLGF